MMMGSSSIHLCLQAAPQPPLARHRQHANVISTGAGPVHRLRLVSSFCSAAGRPNKPSSDLPVEEDSKAARSRKYRDDWNKFAREYRAALDHWGFGVGTSQDAMVQELEAMLFRHEDDKFGSYVRQLSSNQILDKERRRMAQMVCSRVGMAIYLSTRVAANGYLIFNGSSGLLSPLAVKQAIGTYVSTFLTIAEDACHGKIDRTSISSFLGALRGLAAISHVLFEDALAAVNRIEDGSSNYIPEYDVERLNHEMNSNMKELEKKLTMASEREVCYELLDSTMTSAENYILSFVFSMMDLRRKMVIHIEGRHRQQ